MEHRVGIGVGVAQAVECRLALSRREQHEHAFGWIHASQPARQPDRALALHREGIVAAGIENEDHRRCALLLQAIGEAIGGEGGVLDQNLLARIGGGHVDGEKIVRAIDGEAVPCEINKRRVSWRDLAFELDQRAAHGATPDILGLDHVEAELRQFRRDGIGVVHRLLQLWDVLIRVVADDEGDAICCGSWQSGEESNCASSHEGEAHSAPAT